MTSNLLKQIRKFDNGLDTYIERTEFIEELYADVDLVGSTAMCNSEMARTLEEQATYLLNSKDVESGRKQEYAYYRNESDYRSNYSVGINTVSTDFEQREDLHEVYFSESESNITIDNVNELFYLDNMTVEEKKRLIKIGLREKDNDKNSLSDTMQDLYEYILDILDDDIDKRVLTLCSNGLTELEIADHIGVSRRSINKRINRICEKKI